jgi:hypothetical protein
MNISAGTGVPVFATTVTRDAAFGGAGEKVLAEGQLCYLSASNIVQYYDGAAWATVGPSTAVQTAIFNETQSAATNGGASVTGSFIKRTLNTTIVNQITGATLTSSVISLPAGTYLVTALAPFFSSDMIKIRLRNTTDSTTEIIGQNNYTPGNALLNGQFTITGTKNFELQYQCQLAQATFGLGVALAAAAESAVYTIIQIQKVA